MDNIAQHLAAFSASVDSSALPDDVVRQVRLRVIDSVGCALVGFQSPPVQALLGMVEGRTVEDGCRVWSTDLRTTPELAALINGSAVRYLDYNDRMLGGHPSDNIAAVVAACEASSGQLDDLIAGVVVNYEVYGELGRLIIRDYGWDQGTTSVVASACATGRVLGLSVEELGHAIGIAVTAHVATRQSRRGQLSMWKGVAAPYAAQCGLMAAYMARNGLTGPPEPFEGGHGFIEQVYPKGFEIVGLDDPTWPSYLMHADFKYWPMEFNGQAAVWLGTQIHEQLAVDDITEIAVASYEWAWYVIGREPEKWQPTTRETADHSLPYALATAALHGHLDLEHFTDGAFRNPRVLDLMSRISVTPSDELTDAYPASLIMRAKVMTRDGSMHDFEVREPRGRHTNPMTEDEMFAKFARLAQQGALADRSGDLLDALAAIKPGGDLQPILELLAQ